MKAWKNSRDRMPCCFLCSAAAWKYTAETTRCNQRILQAGNPENKIKKISALTIDESASIYVITYIEQMKQIRNSAYNRNGAVFRWIGSENGGMMYVDAEYFGENLLDDFLTGLQIGRKFRGAESNRMECDADRCEGERCRL